MKVWKFCLFALFLMIFTGIAVAFHESIHVLQCSQAGGKIIDAGIETDYLLLGSVYVKCSKELPVVSSELQAYFAQFAMIPLAFFVTKRWFSED